MDVKNITNALVEKDGNILLKKDDCREFLFVIMQRYMFYSNNQQWKETIFYFFDKIKLEKKNASFYHQFLQKLTTDNKITFSPKQKEKKRLFSLLIENKEINNNNIKNYIKKYLSLQKQTKHQHSELPVSMPKHLFAVSTYQSIIVFFKVTKENLLQCVYDGIFCIDYRNEYIIFDYSEVKKQFNIRNKDGFLPLNEIYKPPTDKILIFIQIGKIRAYFEENELHIKMHDLKIHFPGLITKSQKIVEQKKASSKMDWMEMAQERGITIPKKAPSEVDIDDEVDDELDHPFRDLFIGSVIAPPKAFKIGDDDLLTRSAAEDTEEFKELAEEFEETMQESDFSEGFGGMAPTGEIDDSFKKEKPTDLKKQVEKDDSFGTGKSIDIDKKKPASKARKSIDSDKLLPKTKTPALQEIPIIDTDKKEELKKGKIIYRDDSVPEQKETKLEEQKKYLKKKISPKAKQRLGVFTFLISILILPFKSISFVYHMAGTVLFKIARFCKNVFIFPFKWIQEKYQKSIAGVKIPFFESILSDEAGRPGIMERSIAQSRTIMKSLQVIIGLRIISIINLIDNLVEFVAGYISNIYRSWKMAKSIKRRINRSNPQAQIEGIKKDLEIIRTRMSQLFCFSGFEHNIEKSEETFPLALILDIRWRIDEMKRDLSILTIKQMKSTASKTITDFFKSFIPNPLELFTPFKDFIVFSFFMKYTRQDIEIMYIEMLVSYDYIISSLNNQEHLPFSDYEMSMFLRVETQQDKKDLEKHIEDCRLQIQRIIQILTNPRKCIEAKYWNLDDLLYECRLQKNTPFSLECEKRINYYIDNNSKKHLFSKENFLLEKQEKKYFKRRLQLQKKLSSKCY